MGSRNSGLKRVMAVMLAVFITVGCILPDGIRAETKESMVPVYFIDNTEGRWVKNDNAVMELVDNTNGHVKYDMQKQDDSTWKVMVPGNAYNITFNRYDSGKSTQWNSWSAGGRDNHNAYYADGSEYGHWEDIGNSETEQYFHAGDIVYLDLTDFTAWEKDNALMYVNFTAATKEENGGENIHIGSAGKDKYSPLPADYEIKEHIYAYVVSKKDEGNTVLRFWRGNENTLWNCSPVLSYDEYKKGNTCVRVSGWDEQGAFSFKEYEPDYDTDTDNDGVPNYMEALAGLNKHSSDTDGDGLSDEEELLLTDTSPLKYASVTEGVSDADADNDGDGIKNKDEVTFGTDPLKEDTDEDTLTDYEELYRYHTDPVKADTDGDGLSDGAETALGLNPDKQDSNENGIPDSDEFIRQTVDNSRIDEALSVDNNTMVSLEVTAKGNINSRVKLDEYTGCLKGGEHSYVGKAVDIRNLEIQSGTLGFRLGDKYQSSADGLVICRNDGEDTVPLETVYDEEDRTLRTDISRDGVYFVLDAADWFQSFGLELPEKSSINTFSAGRSKDTSISNVKINGQVDIVFITDTTGSMNSYITNVKNNLTAFVSDLEEAGITPYFSLIEYRDIECDGAGSTNVKYNKNNSVWFSSAEDFKNAIAGLYCLGGGDPDESAVDALGMARTLNMRASSQKFFILVTDAGYKVNNNYGIKTMGELADLLKGEGINVSVVTNPSIAPWYKELYETTGGIFADVSGNFKDELLSIADMVADNTNDGYWIALDGLIPKLVKLKEKPYEGSTADTDSDTLPDIQGLNSIQPDKFISFNDYAKALGIYGEYDLPTIPVYTYNSDPTKTDTDEDGLGDGEAAEQHGEIVIPKDSQPKVKNGTKEIWEAHSKNKRDGVIPTEYSDDSGLGVSVNKELADKVVACLVKARDSVNEHERYLRYAAMLVKCAFENDMEQVIYLLNFIYDKDKMAYHSQPDTWQRDFGYNEFYDEVFGIGSKMNNGNVIFNNGRDEYALWMWKGDYWNLQTGAEVGLYTYNTEYSNIKQYDAVDFEVPMTLYSYNYHSKYNIENVFNWEPEDDQWWITGFNTKLKNPVPEEMVTISTIDLSCRLTLYDGLKKSRDYKGIEENNIVFDDESNKVWIIWYNEERVE